MNQKSCVIIKPDGVGKKVVGRIVERFESKDFKLLTLMMFRPTRDNLEEFYVEHKGKEFFEPLLKFMLSGPSIAMVWEGENAISEIRRLVGETDSRKAAPGTLRSLWGTDGRRNLIHASDSEQSAEREISIVFANGAVLTYDPQAWEETA